MGSNRQQICREIFGVTMDHGAKARQKKCNSDVSKANIIIGIYKMECHMQDA